MENSQKQGSHKHYIVPLKVYGRVLVALLILTLLTLLASYVDFGGSLNVIIAVGIAVAKAMLVLLFFMGLKYEGEENNITLFGSFAFLAIFVTLTSADIFYRPHPRPVMIDKGALSTSGPSIDVSKYLVSTPQMVAQGKKLFMQQCVACHGVNGKGDGPAAAALKPKPRNFTSAAGWVNGRKVTEVFLTITHGVSGSAMPAFTTFTPQQKFALAHYVLSLGPKSPVSSPADIAALQKLLGSGGKPHLPISMAMGILEHEWATSHPHYKAH